MTTTTLTRQRTLRSHQNKTYRAYYALLLMITLVGIAYGILFSDIFFPSEKSQTVETLMNLLKLSWVIPFPYALINFYSFVRYPVFEQTTAPKIRTTLPFQLHFRFVTCGHNPRLIAETVQDAYKVLNKTLKHHEWVIEVVTDNPVEHEFADKKIQVIVVPQDYTPEHGVKYKGRALQYTLQTHPIDDHDWVIHLDEETRFDTDTVNAIHDFVLRQHQQVTVGKRQYASIGQGVILYGRGQIVNWITTLADSIRVGDDYGRFRLQFENGKAYFGMHGSFVVINQAVERMIGFDHGPASSITEDAYFALLAQAKGVEFEFIHTFMYEKSPFSIRDFMKQRQRWFGGLWLCTRAAEIPLKERAILGTFMMMWSLSWLSLLMVYINLIYPTGTPAWLAIIGGISFFYYVSLYILGFLRTYSVMQMGKMRFIARLVLQILLIPLFSLMEAGGVIHGLLAPPSEFYVVQKEY